MKKTLFILAIALCGAAMSFAQPKGFVSGGISKSTLDASFGMPISGVVEKSAKKLTLALPFSELVKADLGEVTVMGGTDFVSTPPYFEYHPVTLADKGVHYKYAPKASTKKFDVSAKIKLKVIPCGPDVYAEYTPGDMKYETVPIQGASGKYYCWTKSNLKEDGGVVYDNQTVASFIDTYGRLYTWNEAVKATGSTVPTKTVTIDGTPETFVQGICPDNWHIPTSAEKTDLLDLDVATLNHPSLWQGTHPTYTNTTGFTAVPAGMYNDELARFEGLGTQTDWWTDNDANVSSTLSVIEFSYYCSAPMNKTQIATRGLSVRCVRENIPVE
jgi:uncharacterized protein (TIGR02145 family)